MNFVVPSELENISEDQLHFLPCKIHTKSRANVTNYFRPYNPKNKNSDNVDITYCSFRGKPLIGTQLEIPNGYKGVFCEIAQSDHEEKQTLTAKCSFEKLTYWNWDKEPTKEDNFLSALDWIGISEALHN
ncbi:uncharacterized protein LOC126836493 [Adelges cooleyi]|uniref:uncharacterized protein LOC126836493 n=1 Tax=Adelges cooleyi TaxID=133065 RepID=UPI00218041F5|nr:uncharacterized protein LOC126836493 [Adelges cooleyi]